MLEEEIVVVSDDVEVANETTKQLENEVLG